MSDDLYAVDPRARREDGLAGGAASSKCPPRWMGAAHLQSPGVGSKRGDIMSPINAWLLFVGPSYGGHRSISKHASSLLDLRRRPLVVDTPTRGSGALFAELTRWRGSVHRKRRLRAVDGVGSGGLMNSGMVRRRVNTHRRGVARRRRLILGGDRDHPSACRIDLARANVYRTSGEDRRALRRRHGGRDQRRCAGRGSDVQAALALDANRERMVIPVGGCTESPVSYEPPVTRRDLRVPCAAGGARSASGRSLSLRRGRHSAPLRSHKRPRRAICTREGLGAGEALAYRDRPTPRA